MNDLFASHGPRRLDMRGADVVLHQQPDLGMHPDDLLRRLLDETPWRQGEIRTRNGTFQEPRLTSWHGDAEYSYSGRKLKPLPWSPLLASLRDRLTEITGSEFNSVLLNRYRGGRDSIGMHSDDEPGVQPTIASVSLGAERVFDMRRKDGTGSTIHVPLTHGSLLVMSGDTQRNWLHGIAKTRQPVGERVNLTFRLTRVNGR